MALPQIGRIGVLTSGGDCAGLNAVIRAVTARAVNHYGLQVYGILDGTLGLMERPLRYVELTPSTFDGRIFREGGTVLGTTNKGDPFRFPMADGSVRDRSQDFGDGVRELELDALVVIGGDGSMSIVSRLCHAVGVGMVGVPKTIDNDVHGTDFSIGHATAVGVVTDAMDRLQPTAASHHRVMIVEVMGRDAGYIAMQGGIAGGADVVLVPEIPYSMDGVATAIRKVLDRGRTHALVVVAEGVKRDDGSAVHSPGSTRYGGIGHWLGERIAETTHTETRVTILGHVQRGGSPSPQDRLLASAFGVHAVDLVMRGQLDRMVAWRNLSVVDVPLSEVTIGARPLDPNGTLATTAHGLGIYIGDTEPAG